MIRNQMLLKITGTIIKDPTCIIAIVEKWQEIYRIVATDGWDAVPLTYICALYQWMEKNNLF